MSASDVDVEINGKKPKGDKTNGWGIPLMTFLDLRLKGINGGVEVERWEYSKWEWLQGSSLEVQWRPSYNQHAEF